MSDIYKTRALQLLANGFAKQFVEYCEGDQRLCEVMHELVTDFIDENIPVVDDDNKLNLAFLLLDRVYLKDWTDKQD